MGYTTTFEGAIKIEPPLSEKEIDFLNKFSNTRRMARAKGPYYVDGEGSFVQNKDPDILDYNKPPEPQLSLWCGWAPSEDGQWIQWNGTEKFYNSVEWMRYLIEHFIGPEPLAQELLPFFTGHECNGIIQAQGEDVGDVWVLIVEDNEVRKMDGETIDSLQNNVESMVESLLGIAQPDSILGKKQITFVFSPEDKFEAVSISRGIGFIIGTGASIREAVQKLQNIQEKSMDDAMQRMLQNNTNTEEVK